jgi:hypothetical protein
MNDASATMGGDASEPWIRFTHSSAEPKASRVGITFYTVYDKLYIALGSTIVIKDIDEAVYRSLKGEAIKSGLRVGDAASQAFRLWVQQRNLGRVRDRDAMRRASKAIDLQRAKIGVVKGWSSTEVIRKWRELRRP